MPIQKSPSGATGAASVVIGGQSAVTRSEVFGSKLYNKDAEGSRGQKEAGDRWRAGIKWLETDPEDVRASSPPLLPMRSVRTVRKGCQ